MALILIAAAIRIPFLVYNFGLLDSDDVIPILVGKHISEGKLPPIYHYGQQYLGTFPYHIYALMFKIFGYSILVVLLVSLIFYLVFIVAQFIIFKEVFASSNQSLVLCVFYCLPIGHLLAVSFHIGISFSLVLCLGSLAVYLSFLIYKKNREELIPLLGFSLGFLFWIHPESVVFALCSMIIVALRIRFNLRKYFHLAIYALIGSFPFILSETGQKFASLKHIFSGRKIQDTPLEKIKAMFEDMIFLVSTEKNFLNYIYIFLIVFGIVGIIYLSLRRRKFLPENIFVIFLVVFIGVYILSTYSNADLAHARYLYPVYYVLPVFLASIFNLLKRKAMYIPVILLFLCLVIFNNIKDTSRSYSLVKQAHVNLKKIIQTMEMTGERYWVGSFWQVLLITGLSGEKIIGWSYPHEDYFPYKLMYFNQGNNNNYVFFKESGSYAVKFKKRYPNIAGNLDRDFEQSAKLIKLLDRLGIEGKKEQQGDFFWLVYGISGQFHPLTLRESIPQKIPELAISKTECSKGELSLTFKNQPTFEKYHFRLHIEIPHYSSIVRTYPSNEAEMKLIIPFPPQESFKIRYYLDYMGLNIPSTEKEMIYCPSDKDLKAKRKSIMFLSGIGPWMEENGKRWRICEKEVNFEINKLLDRNLRVRLYLNSPFDFSHPHWYGDYSQEVRIEINGNYLTEKRLKEGNNIIEFNLRDAKLQKSHNFLKLKFKYHLSFEFKPLWKISALLEKIEIL